MEIIDHGHGIIEYRDVIADPYGLIATIEDLDNDRGVYQVLPPFDEWKEGYVQPDGVWRAVNVKGRNKVFNWHDSLKLQHLAEVTNQVGLQVVNPIIDPVTICANDYASRVGIEQPRVVSKNVDLRIYTVGNNLGVHEDTNHGEPLTTHSLVIYLNDNYEGGEVNFPELGLKIKPKAGSVVAFPATTPHESLVITSGEKWHSPYFWYSSIGLITSGKEAPSLDRFKPMLNIALLGFGQVGREVYRQLTQHPEYQNKFVISRIQIDSPTKDRGTHRGELPITADVQSLLDSDIYNTVIDCTEYNEASKNLILGLLKKKITLYTCSKELAWEHWQELIATAQQGGASINFNSIPSSPSFDKYKGIDLTDKNFHEHEGPDLYVYREAGAMITAAYIVRDLLEQKSI